MGRKYLVTGANGNVGFHVVKQLLDEGKDVVATDLSSPDQFALNFKDSILPKNLSYKPADMTNRFNFHPIFNGVTDVIHVAALFNHNAKGELLNRVNKTGIENLMYAAIVISCTEVEQIVVFGSSSVYGYELVAEESGYALHEDKQPNPQNPYAKSKQSTREIAAAYNGRKGIQIRIVDPTGVFGPRNKYGNLTVLEAAVNGAFWLPNDGRNRSSNIHAEDAAGFAIYLLDNMDRVSTRSKLTSQDPQELSYLVATPDALTAKDLMQLVWENIPKEKRKEGTRRFTEFLGKRIELTAEIALPFSRLVHCLLGKRTPAMLNPYVARYGFSDQSADPHKMLATGYQLKFPTMEHVIEDTMRFHRDNPTGLLNKKK